MKRFLAPLTLLMVALTGLNAEEDAPRVLDKANVLPLAITDDIEFRKTVLSTVVKERIPRDESNNPMLYFERRHRLFGAVDNIDLKQRYGTYFTFFWRANRQADVTFRLEYRQEKLGSWVQAMERSYPAAKGNFKTLFQVTGDEFESEGKVTSWRAIVIEDGKIVALDSSFLWN